MNKLKMIAIGWMTLMMVTGCNLTDDMPSFYDDNESKQIIDIVVAIDNLDCSNHFIKQQIQVIQREYVWLEHYAKAKGSNDVVEMLQPLKQSLEGLYSKGSISTNYCRLKRDSLYKQSTTIAEAIMGRY